MGAKPSRQTPADKRLKRNAPKSTPKPAFGGKKAPAFKPKKG